MTSLRVAAVLAIVSGGLFSPLVEITRAQEPTSASDDTKAEPLARWASGVKVAPVSGDDHHSIHTYFNASPESPDGRWVLFYASTTADAHRGELRIRERSTGREVVLAREVEVEDAHRAACQQWTSGGRRVAYHNVLPAGEWVVMAVEVPDGMPQVLARGRQLGFGQPHADVVPLYGPHWDPGTHRGLELLNVATGEITPTALSDDVVRRAEPAWVAEKFGDRPISVFFPLLSPDLRRVMFKVASPAGGDFRSRQASNRHGLLCYDLRAGQILWHQRDWGHPAWHPDSTSILNTRGRLIDAETGETRTIPDLPAFPGSHPSFSPDGALLTTDLQTDRPPYDGPKGSWGIAVADVRTGRSLTLHRFDNAQGARSWRVSHPHPAFSADGRRIYFNVSDGRWTRLYVAEAGE